jgi:hypothetical protein
MPAIIVYAEDCVLSGSLDLGRARLSDLLNDRTELDLTAVVVTSLVDDHVVGLPELVVAADEILAVEVDGARGDPGRRRRTRQFPLMARLGPYIVRGSFHALPGADPLDSFARRATFVPLTDASVEFAVADEVRRHYADAVLVNRELADEVDVIEDQIRVPEIHFRTAPHRLRAKDLTYDVEASTRER